VQTGESADLRRTEVTADLEERLFVEDMEQDLARVVDLASLARDNGDQLFVAAARVVGGGASRRRFPNARRQVRQELLALRERVLFVLGRVVDGARLARVDLPTAELLLR
jgi:hypothetical protein